MFSMFPLVSINSLIPKEVKPDDFSTALRGTKPTELDVESKFIWQRRRERYEQILQQAIKDK